MSEWDRPVLREAPPEPEPRLSAYERQRVEPPSPAFWTPAPLAERELRYRTRRVERRRVEDRAFVPVLVTLLCLLALAIGIMIGVSL